MALSTAGFVLASMAGELADGDALIERALKLNPNFAWGWFFSGWVKAMSGEPEAAIERCTQALQLSPNDPHSYSMHLTIAFAHFIASRFEEALAVAESASRLQPDQFSSLATIAASAALTGQAAKASLAMARLLELLPDLRLANLRERFPIKGPEDFARWAEGLRRAGLPE